MLSWLCFRDVGTELTGTAAPLGQGGTTGWFGSQVQLQTNRAPCSPFYIKQRLLAIGLNVLSLNWRKLKKENRRFQKSCTSAFQSSHLSVDNQSETSKDTLVLNEKKKKSSLWFSDCPSIQLCQYSNGTQYTFPLKFREVLKHSAELGPIHNNQYQISSSAQSINKRAPKEEGQCIALLLCVISRFRSQERLLENGTAQATSLDTELRRKYCRPLARRHSCSLNCSPFWLNSTAWAFYDYLPKDFFMTNH